MAPYIKLNLVKKKKKTLLRNRKTVCLRLNASHDGGPTQKSGNSHLSSSVRPGIVSSVGLPLPKDIPNLVFADRRWTLLRI